MHVLLLTRPQPTAAFREAIHALAPEITVHEELAGLDAADPALIEALVCYRLPKGVCARLPNLKVVCASSAGVDKILPVPDLPAHVAVARVVDAAQNAQIAQYVAMMALRHVRNAPLYERQQREKAWTRHPIPAPDGCTVGLLGLGASGQRVAASLGALGFRLAGWSRSPRTLPGIDCYSGSEGLGQCLARADILVCLLPLTDDTRGLLGRENLSRLPRGAYLINVARGEHVNEPELLALLDEGHLSGAALDVQSREPLPPESPLWTHPAVTVTPHVASQPTPQAVAAQVVENMRRLQAGRPLANAVDRRTGY